MRGTPNTCEAEYAKDPTIKPEDIRSLMEWLKKEPHMPDISEYQLIQFYHACEYSTQKTKRLLEVHYTFKSEMEELITLHGFGSNERDIRLWDIFYGFDLPNTTPKGYRVVYVGLRDADPAQYTFEGYIAMHVKLMLTLLMEQGLCAGYSSILDFKGYGFSHVTKINLTNLKKFMFLAQETCQIRMKEIHLVNGPGIIEKLMILARPFLKKELMDMIRVHTDMNKLYDHCGKENIPVDLGGTLPQTREELNDDIKKRMTSLSTIVQEEFEKRTNETLRTASKQNDFSTSYGSFKQISID